MLSDTELLQTEEISLRRIELDKDDPQRKWDPAFHFDILDHTGTRVGGCNLRLGMEYVIIVCAPSNQPSRKTCEWLGGELLEIAELPEDDKRRLTGDIYRCIFRFSL